VVGFAAGGSDLINCLKQAGEFGLVRGGQRLAGITVLINQIHSLGLGAGGAVLLGSDRWHAGVFATICQPVQRDGRKIHDLYLFEVKTPAALRCPWDYCKTLHTIPAEQAFRPIDQGGCPMIHS
jgi:branched-chain amino acid transport system substrate-binding protein